MKRYLPTLLACSLLYTCVQAQSVSINTTGASPDASAILDVQASDKGMLIPRLTSAQRTGISSPATGLMVYDTDRNAFWYFDGTDWAQVGDKLEDTDGDTRVDVEDTPDEDEIRFVIDGAEAMRLDANGNLGVGVADPIEKLEVNGSIRLDDASGTPEAGTMRWNPATQDFEGYDGSSWQSFTQSGGQTFPETETQKVIASDGASSDHFGFSMAIDGDYAIIGTELDDDNGSGAGSAYIFKRTSGGWVQHFKLLASDGAADDQFGTSVSILGDYALVGAWHDDDNGSNSGSAYLFNRTGDTWTQIAKLVPGDGGVDHEFGVSVAISDSFAIIGARQDDANGTGAGSAYVYAFDGSSWTQSAKLLASDGAASDFFGSFVDIENEYALVGAPNDDDAGSESGSAYVYYRTGTSWSEQAKLTPSDGIASGLFGQRLSLEGDYALISAFQDDDNGTNSGSAYIFYRTGTSWAQQAKLLPEDGGAEENFGISATLSGRYALIGSFRNDESATDGGAAYLYVRNGDSWRQQTKLTASDAAAGDWFGFGSALDSPNALVGARSDDDGGTDAGSAYFFEAE